jgi:predicted Kef-type K+ transport protein
MGHNIPLITTIAAGFGVALILRFIAERIKIPALVGYLIAGSIIGSATPGFRGRCEYRVPTVGDRRHVADVRCWASFFVQ